jgi:hypothetical protein
VAVAVASPAAWARGCAPGSDGERGEEDGELMYDGLRHPSVKRSLQKWQAAVAAAAVGVGGGFGGFGSSADGDQQWWTRPEKPQHLQYWGSRRCRQR